MPQAFSSVPCLRAYARTQASTASMCLRKLSECVYSHSRFQASSRDGIGTPSLISAIKNRADILQRMRQMFRGKRADLRHEYALKWRKCVETTSIRTQQQKHNL